MSAQRQLYQGADGEPVGFIKQMSQRYSDIPDHDADLTPDEWRDIVINLAADKLKTELALTEAKNAQVQAADRYSLGLMRMANAVYRAWDLSKKDRDNAA